MKEQPAMVENATEDATAVVIVRNLYKSFGDRKVLSGVTLDLKERENLVILGKSGTGKSVLIKCIAGLLKPDSGEINVLGYDVPSLSLKELNKLRLQIGFSFQGSALYDSMSVRENLEFPLKRNLGIYDRSKLNKLVMKKRVGIARTLILNPKIMLYDEPTAGLDPETATEINELILSVREKYHTASIIITHDLSCARQVSDRIVALFDGINKLEGTFDELKQQNAQELQSFFNY
jgi:phospholipid/cholesterol/gamma-HCH transport system ATP-binding protein